jgi:hypothetical protein
MTTAMADQPPSAGVEAASGLDAPPAPSPWLCDLADAVRALRKPFDVFTPPPPDASFDELVAALRSFDKNAIRTKLDVARVLLSINRPTSLFFTGDAGSDLMGVVLESRLADKLVSEIAGTAESPTHRDRMHDNVKWFLSEINAAIRDRLLAGERDDSIIWPGDFNGSTSTNHSAYLDLGDRLGYVQTGVVSALPDGHPVKRWPKEMLLDGSIILGPVKPHPLHGFSSPGDGHLIYPSWTSFNTTRSARMARLAKQRSRPAYLLADGKLVQGDSETDRGVLEHLDAMDKALKAIQARRPSELLPPKPAPRSWSENIAAMFEALRGFKWTKPPGDDVPLHDLIVARRLIVTSDLENSSDPDLAGAIEFAAALGGDMKREDLIGALRPVVAHMLFMLEEMFGEFLCDGTKIRSLPDEKA